VSINGCGGSLSYDAARYWWQWYCGFAVEIGIQRFRHANATELVSSCVFTEVVRRRVGLSAKISRIYAELGGGVEASVRSAVLTAGAGS
jgi:hypothetical protein